MARKLICGFSSEYYNDHARLLFDQMVQDQKGQCVRSFKTEIPLRDKIEPPKPTVIEKLLNRKSQATTVSEPTPYKNAVSDAYRFLGKRYQAGDEIVLFAVTGVPGDWEVLQGAVRVLAEHLEVGTEPPRVAPARDPAHDTEEDTFCDQPQEEPPNFLLGNRVESSVVIIYRAEVQVSEINNFLLHEFPLSVKHVFSFNWGDGHENYCSTFRDNRGQVTSREVCYFSEIQWHIPVVTNATMSFIHYKPTVTQAWKSIKPSIPRALTSLPAPLIPEFPPSPTIVSTPTPRRSRFNLGLGRRSTTRSSTAPTARTFQRSSTFMSGFTTQRSDSLMSSYTTVPRVSSPSSMASFSSPAPSRASTSDSIQSSSATTFTQSSHSSIDSLPALRETYNSLPGMTKHQVWTYPAFRKRLDDHALPARVVWRSSRE